MPLRHLFLSHKKRKELPFNSFPYRTLQLSKNKRSAFRTDLQHMACTFAKHLFDLLFIIGHIIVVYERLDRPRKAAAMDTDCTRHPP